jgi:hypothetical protein
MPKPAKASESSPAPAPTPRHAVKLAHPDEMPPVLDAMIKEGWELINIVSCRHTHEHAAYFHRT